MTNELMVSEQKAATIFDMTPKAMVGHVSQVATVLRDVIKQQQLAVNIQGREYVKVDGWAAMGTILGLLPREVEVKELDDGSYEAKVELYSVKTGQVVGQGSALCGIDEKRWGNADRYARRSMAITRATGKAYRLGLSWVMSMAGYMPTPAEEMPIDGDYSEPAPAKSAPKAQQRKEAEVYEGTEKQNEGVERVLTTRGIDRKYWPEISAKLMGKKASDLLSVIRQVVPQ